MMNNLYNLVLAPYILKATTLIGVHRNVGGNQFRHAFATLGILLDYKYCDPILLKASLLHDIIEDSNVDLNEIKNIDNDGPSVVNLVLEVTRRKDETKEEYLIRLQNSSKLAKILKCADRISNLTDLHLDIYTNNKIFEYLQQTEKYIIPLANEVDENFKIELMDLIKQRMKLCDKKIIKTKLKNNSEN